VGSNLLNLLRVYRGCLSSGEGPCLAGAWPGRGNTAALSPGPSGERPAAWRRAPDCVVFTWHTDLPMTEGVQREDTP